MKIKTIDINAKSWFDGVNGNSYFSARITLNFGMDDSKELVIPFQYGYGDHYVDMSFRELVESGHIDFDKRKEAKSCYCRKNDIILRCNKGKALKREVTAWGEK